MAHLPTVTWHDVATKDDLRALESVLQSDVRSEFARFDARFADVRTEMHKSMVQQTRWTVGFICWWSVVVVTVARLLL